VKTKYFVENDASINGDKEGISRETIEEKDMARHLG